MYPPRFGNSSSMVTVPLEEARPAADALERIVATIPLRGMFSAEFKRDEDDGVFRILEVNARAWWYIEFAARAGMDVASMTYDAALGRAVRGPDDYEVGRRLVYPYFDYSACLQEATSRTRAVGRMIRDWWGADQPVFRFSDPVPSVLSALRHTPGALRRRIAPGDSARSRPRRPEGREVREAPDGL